MIPSVEMYANLLTNNSVSVNHIEYYFFVIFWRELYHIAHRLAVTAIVAISRVKPDVRPHGLVRNDVALCQTQLTLKTY